MTNWLKPLGASLDKLASGAGLKHGRPAVDKLLARRNSGLTLQGLDLGVGPSGAIGIGFAKLAIGAGLD